MLDAYYQYEGPRTFVGSFIGYRDHQREDRTIMPLSAAAPLRPGQTAQISARVIAHAFRPRKMTAIDPEGWAVSAFRIGTRSQFSGAVPVPLSKLTEHELEYDTVQVSQDLVIDIVNCGGSRKAQVAIVRLDGVLYRLHETRCTQVGPLTLEEASLILIPPRTVSVHVVGDHAIDEPALTGKLPSLPQRYRIGLQIVDESSGGLILEMNVDGLRFDIAGQAAQAAPLVLDETS